MSGVYAAFLRKEIAAIGGANPLERFVDSPTARIDLSSAHPSGLASLMSGRLTRLSALVRDDLASRLAVRAAENITARANTLKRTRGIFASALAIGTIGWQFEGRDYLLPIIVRPLTIKQVGKDFDLRLVERAKLNPALVRLLANQYQIQLDGEKLISIAFEDGVFRPQTVLERIKGLTAHIEGAKIQNRILVSVFAEVAPQMLVASETLSHPLLDALENSDSHSGQEDEGLVAGLSLANARYILDADEQQQRVIRAVSAGKSLLVHTPAGSGITQTVVNSLAELVTQNKRILVVAPAAATLDAVTARFESVGLHGITVSNSNLVRSAIKSILRFEKAKPAATEEVDEALSKLETVLGNYRAALTEVDPITGKNILEVLNKIAELSMQQTAPQTEVRFSQEIVEKLSDSLTEAAAMIEQIATLGQFSERFSDTPWYGAKLTSVEQSREMLQNATKLKETYLPRLLANADTVFAGTPLPKYQNLRQIGERLNLLLGIRSSLDRFKPVVFQRPIKDLVRATSPDRKLADMSKADRRRLKGLAKEYVRPGANVPDLHSALSEVEEQFYRWHTLVESGIDPQVPAGLDGLLVTWQSASEMMQSLDNVLEPTQAGSLFIMDTVELTKLLERLCEPSPYLENLKDRAELLEAISALGLNDFIADLTERHVATESVKLELELAWWQSALENILLNNKALLGANTDVLGRLEADFKLVDETNQSHNAMLLNWQQANNWNLGISEFNAEAGALKQSLKDQNLSSRSLALIAPNLSKIFAPIWLSSPYLVPEIDSAIKFDAVFILDAASTTLAENIPAILRANQVVAFADEQTQIPTSFDIGIIDGKEVATIKEPSAFQQLATALPVYSLSRRYRPTGLDLAKVVDSNVYAEKLDGYSWAGSFLGNKSVQYKTVEKIQPGEDALITPEVQQPEIAAVVEEVVRHAIASPARSLMVVTANPKQVPALVSAISQSFADRPALANFLIDKAESFQVSTLMDAANTSRDRIIFTPGFEQLGSTKVPGHLLGEISIPSGRVLLSAMIARAREELTIISSLNPEQIEPGNITGAFTFKQLLEQIRDLDRSPGSTEISDYLLLDLSSRLEKQGVQTVLGFSPNLRLIAYSEGTVVGIQTDEDLLGATLRETLRVIPKHLEALSWKYLRILNFDLFADPEAQVAKIKAELGA